MTENQMELFAIHGSFSRPASKEELNTAKPFFHQGDGERGQIGILMVHGFTTTPAIFYEYSLALAEKGYTVYAPLLPRHGLKAEALLDAKWEEWLDATLKAYHKLKKLCKTVFVVGQSMAGGLVLQLAAKEKDIAKLYLVGPAIYLSLLQKISLNLFTPLLKFLGMHFWKAVAGDIKDPKAYDIAYNKCAIHGILEMVKCMHQSQNILSQVVADLVVFQSPHDHCLPAKKAAKILKNVRSKTKEIIWLSRSYHSITKDYDAPVILERILSDLAAMELKEK